MSTLARYLLLQIPGWILTLLIGLALHYWLSLPLWVVIVLISISVLKDLIAYPFMKRAYEPETMTAVERLIGEHAIAKEPLAPTGYVIVRGELWKAETEGEMPVAATDKVQVVGTRGMTLIVRKVA